MCGGHITKEVTCCCDLNWSNKAYDIAYEVGFGLWFELDWAGRPNHSIAARHVVLTERNLTSYAYAIVRSGSSSSSSVTRPLSASSTTTSTTHSELAKYLDTDFSLLDSTTNIEDFKILDWWRLQSTNFPALSRLARAILTILVSTVSSESAFSTVGRIIEDRRTSLTPEMVEVLTCLKDWEHADKRMQYTVEDQEILRHFNEMTIIDDDDIDNDFNKV
ncbi:hypothetical protein TIFTF001_027838 [Ficus carica]|uniref:HAT C-terminal dimerisation domain-containing protein n=1 Tax=Ficus carica TaxID=3494 RepID=A0AA88DNQ7_FICCA|nr:hypothetical protein TIFTF001_027838 [Ficus carica]